MTPEKAQRLAQLADQLAETLLTATNSVGEMRATLVAELDRFDPVNARAAGDGPPPSRSQMQRRPWVDYSTLSLMWSGKTCYLGLTVLLRLADRLSRRPNHYITPDQLRRDVWAGDLRSPDTIRSAVRNLRQRLTDAGMEELAAAIQGHGGGYGLMLRNTP